MEHGELTALIVKAQSGDQGAMEELLRTAHTSISYQCRKLLSDPRDAEDATQEILLKVYEQLDKLKEPAAFWGWLNSMTVRHCINAKTRARVDLQFSEDEEGHSVLDDLEELDEQQVPDKALDNAETTRMIEEIVNRLPEAQRVCTLMYYYDEMTVKEIAEVIGAPENTVKSRLNYARKAIKEQVLDYEKRGVKLYGLSPLPFLLYFLSRAARESADPAKAGAAAKRVMELGASAAAGGNAAAGTAAVSGTSSAAAAGASAAVGAAATAGTAVSHFLGGLSAKAVAGILAAILAVGGIAGAVALVNQNEPEPTVPVEQETVTPEPVGGPIETGANEGNLIPEDPGPLDSPYDTITVYDPDTMISRTTMITGLDNLEIYYEIPLFPETTEGYRVINDYFRAMRNDFFRDESGNIALALGYASAPTTPDLYYDTYRCSIETHNSEITSVQLLGNWYMGGMRDGSFPAYTFRGDTGEQLSVLDVLDCTAYEFIEMLAEKLDKEGILDYVDLDGNPYVDLSRDPAEYPFYISDGAVFVGVKNVPMWHGEYYVKLDAPLRMGGSAPSAPPSGNPSDLLGSIAYYGDLAQCRMTADQARAFAEVIESETAALETQYAQDPTAGSRGEINAYAALIDIGNGNPILIYIGGLRRTDIPALAGLSDIIRSGIWQYIEGRAVAFPVGTGMDQVRWDGSHLFVRKWREPFSGQICNAQVYDVIDGVLSEAPISTVSEKYLGGPGTIDGQSASVAEYNSWWQYWYGYDMVGQNTTAMGMEETVAERVEGMGLAADTAAALRDYARS